MQSTSHIILAIVKADTLLDVNDSYVYPSTMTYIELCSIVVISCNLPVQVAYACPLQGTVFTRLTHVPEMNVFHRGLLVSGMPRTTNTHYFVCHCHSHAICHSKLSYKNLFLLSDGQVPLYLPTHIVLSVKFMLPTLWCFNFL